jgi:thiol-disulfide isomerase/thioredoxin
MSSLVGSACPDFPVSFAAKPDEKVAISSICKDSDVVVLDFYTNWCKACPDTAKFIDSTAAKNGNGKARFLLINLENDAEDADAFFRAHDLKHAESCIVDDDLLTEFGIAGIPHKVIVKNNVVIANGPAVNLADFDVESGRFKGQEEAEKTVVAYHGSSIWGDWVLLL